MTINVNYYAMFREAAGRSEEAVDAASSNAVELFEALKARYDFTLYRSSVRLAINDAFVDWETPLSEGDSIVFIPPVAGG